MSAQTLADPAVQIVATTGDFVTHFTKLCAYPSGRSRLGDDAPDWQNIGMGEINSIIWAERRSRAGGVEKVYPHRYPDGKFMLHPSSGDESNKEENARLVGTLGEVCSLVATGDWTLRMSPVDGSKPSRYSKKKITIAG